MSAADEEPPRLRLRRDGDRVRLEDPSRPGAWLSIDGEQVFDAAAVNDLP